MEKETNVLHLLTQHPIALFVVAAVILLLVILGIVALFSRRIERKRDKKINGD